MAQTSDDFAEKAIAAYERMSAGYRISLDSDIINGPKGKNEIMEDYYALWQGYTKSDIHYAQDNILRAMDEGHPLSSAVLQTIPPRRVERLARIARKADIPLEHGTYEQLLEACKIAGSWGKLCDWWYL